MNARTEQQTSTVFETFDNAGELETTVVRAKLEPHFRSIGVTGMLECRFRSYHEQLSAETALPTQYGPLEHIRRNQSPFEFDSVEHELCLLNRKKRNSRLIRTDVRVNSLGREVPVVSKCACYRHLRLVGLDARRSVQPILRS